ncbi:nicalin precursor [Pelomyxa schiedti]|nr:nicalin precursor [Pelomyxa schiedti]
MSRRSGSGTLAFFAAFAVAFFVAFAQSVLAAREFTAHRLAQVDVAVPKDAGNPSAARQVVKTGSQRAQLNLLDVVTFAETDSPTPEAIELAKLKELGKREREEEEQADADDDGGDDEKEVNSREKHADDSDGKNHEDSSVNKGDSIDLGGEKSTLFRHAVVVDFPDATFDVIHYLTDIRGAGAVIVLLPDRDTKLSQAEELKWRNTEQQLMTSEITAPVYFAHKSDVPSEFLTARRGALRHSDHVRLVSSASQPAPVPDFTLTDLRATLLGPNNGVAEDGEKLPSIGIVAHYDTFSAVPSLTEGADSNGSGAVALLELLRIFSRLYRGAKTQPLFNLEFLLTSGGPMNFAGSKYWLDNVANEDTHFDFVICLDSIGMSDSLHLHISRPPKEGVTQNLYDLFTQQASAMGISFSLVHKKINISNPQVAWEHEHFSMKHFTSATLSHFASPVSSLFRSHIFDTADRINTSSLETNIQFLGEVIAQYIFKIKDSNFKVFQNEYQPDISFINSWLNTLSREQRQSPLSPKGLPVVSSLKKLVSQHANDVVETTWKVTNKGSGLVFYGQHSVTLSAYHCKPFYFDVLLLLLIVASLIALYTVLKGREEALRQIRAIFATKKAPAIKRDDKNKKKR